MGVSVSASSERHAMSRTEQRTETFGDVVEDDRQVCPPLFAVDVKVLTGETVLTLHGELDISTQQQLAVALAGVDESAGRIVLDLSDLTFIDGSSIGLIYKSRIRAGLRGAHLELRNPDPNLLRILELTGLSASNGNGVRPNVLPLPARTYDRPDGREMYQAP